MQISTDGVMTMELSGALKQSRRSFAHDVPRFISAAEGGEACPASASKPLPCLGMAICEMIKNSQFSLGGNSGSCRNDYVGAIASASSPGFTQWYLFVCEIPGSSGSRRSVRLRVVAVQQYIVASKQASFCSELNKLPER